MYLQYYSNDNNLKGKHYATVKLSFNSISNSFFNDFDESIELLDKLESIEKEMLNGAGITFRDVDELDRKF